MTKEEMMKAFQESKQRYQKKLEDEAKKSNGNFSRDYEQIVYTPFLEKEWQIVRILDGFFTPDDPKRLPTSPKEILRAYIVNDEGKGCWINFSDDKKWLLWKIYNKVLSYTWNPDLGEKGGKEYHYQKQFPSLFNQVKYNGKANPSPFENGWYPTKYVLMNNLDRKDKVWHQENKHSKLLSKKQTIKDGVSYCEPGIPPTVYSEKIFQGVVETYGILDYYDIGLRKVKTLSSGKETTNYEVQHAKFLVDIDNLKDYIVTGDLTEEEKSYEKYDLDKLFPVATYHKIHKNLEIFIKDVDKKLGTNFSKELSDLVEEEKVKFEEIYGKQENDEALTSYTEIAKNNGVEVVGEKEITEEKVEQQKASRRPMKKEENIKDDVAIIEKFPAYEQLLQEEKDCVLGLNESGELLFKESKEGMVPCPNPDCQKPQVYEISSMCIYCGTKFEE